MRALRLTFVALLGLAAAASCKGEEKKEPAAETRPAEQSAPRPAPAPAAVPGEAAPAAGAEDKAEAECTDWCTLVAGCWEKVNEGEEYNAGGQCEAACARRPDAERQAYGACVMAKTADCKAMLDC